MIHGSFTHPIDVSIKFRMRGIEPYEDIISVSPSSGRMGHVSDLLQRPPGIIWLGMFPIPLSPELLTSQSRRQG